MKRFRKKFYFILFVVFTQLLVFFPINTNHSLIENHDSLNDDSKEDPKETPLVSDVSGNDMYSEQISAYVAGSKSIIRQSFFTNDTNILKNFDTKDPAFYNCNVLIIASNGITPEMFPSVLMENLFGTQFTLSYSCFLGFLHYNPGMKAKDIEPKAERALEIIKRKFEIDLIMVNSSESHIFPFVAYYPDWEVFFKEITGNLPMDGYWDALDVDRLTDDDYLENHHLSTAFLMVNSLDTLEESFDFSTDLLNFDIDSIGLSLLENVEMTDFIDQLSDLSEIYSELFGNISEYLGSSDEFPLQEEFEQIADVFETYVPSNDSTYTTLMVQYEGKSEGIKKIAGNRYKFNLWDAMGYDDDELSPSKKIYISLIGAFMTEIDINLLCTDLIDYSPEYFEFSDYMLEQIESILYLAGVEYDLDVIKEYSLELLWVNDNGFYRSYVRPVNLNDPEDEINFIRQLGIPGIPFMTTGLTNPEDIKITYEASNSEPNMRITKELIGNNASYGAYRDFSFNITAENVGNTTVWGVPTEIPITLTDLFTLIVGEDAADDLYDYLWDVVEDLYPGKYDSLEEFFNMDEDPRIFYFDTWGLGIVDYFVPDLLNITNLWPYSEDIDPIINAVPSIILPPALKSELKDAFKNENSVWYDENWYLESGKKITYLTDNISYTNLDTFTPFYSYNFTIRTTPPELPAVVFGNSIENTTPNMALQADNESWVIESEQRYTDQHELEVQFLFQNQSIIDLINNTLERVSIILNFSSPPSGLSYEIFNFSKGEFQSIFPDLDTITNISRTFSFIEYNNSLNWLFDDIVPENRTLIFKLRGINEDTFNISIDNLDVELSTRDINSYKVLGSRVIFTSMYGKAQLIRTSSSINIGTANLSSIIAKANITSYNSKVGELNNYTINIKNIGSCVAKNVNISLLVPGIIHDCRNFTLDNNYLIYNLSQLAPSEEKTVSFTFYTPNSGTIKPLIKYNNPVEVQNINSTALNITANEVYFSAPVDYDNRFPFVRTIKIYYDSSNSDPEIGDTFKLYINIKNAGPKGISIPELNFTMNDYYGDLKRIDDNKLFLKNIAYKETKSLYIELKKKDWKGYYYPPINYFESNESRTIQISKTSPIVLGDISFSIKKSVSKQEIEYGEKIEVTIKIKNTGSICVKDIVLNDETSFTNLEFSLVKGKLVNEIDNLDPDETKKITYKIKAQTLDIVTLKEAKIEYYFLLEETEESNIVEIMINIPTETQLLLVIIPSIIILGNIGIYWQYRRYKLKKEKLERKEMKEMKNGVH